MIYLASVYFEHMRNPRCFGKTTRVTVHGGVPKDTAGPLLLWVAGAKPSCRRRWYCHLFALQAHKVPPWRGHQALPEHFVELCSNLSSIALLFLLVFMQWVYSETRVSHSVHAGLSSLAMGWSPAVPVKCHKNASRHCGLALTWVSNEDRDSGFRAINLCPFQCEGKMFPELLWI